jgi:hypothetical protein
MLLLLLFTDIFMCMILLTVTYEISAQYSVLIGHNATRSTPHEHQLHFNTITHLVQRENTTV